MWRAPAVKVAGVTKSSRATNHIGRTDGRPFPLPSTVGHPLLSRCNPRVFVSVRILHDFLRVRCRSKSGSLVHGRISGGISVLGKSAQPLLVAARRGMASKRNGARGLLPPARAVDQDVRTLDEASDQQGRSPRTCE